MGSHGGCGQERVIEKRLSIRVVIHGAVFHDRRGKEVIEQIVLIGHFGRVEHVIWMQMVHVLELTVQRIVVPVHVLKEASIASSLWYGPLQRPRRDRRRLRELCLRAAIDV